MRQGTARGGNVLTSTSSGVTGAQQGPRADQGEESQGDRKFLAHDDSPFVCRRDSSQVRAVAILQDAAGFSYTARLSSGEPTCAWLQVPQSAPLLATANQRDLLAGTCQLA